MSARRHRGEGSPEVTLPITPMLDMAFQLLTFFIFTYHPSAMEGQMDLTLPSEAPKAAKDPSQVNPQAASDKDATIELPSDLTVIIRTQQDNIHNGIISALTVQESSGGTPLGSDLAQLEKYLKDAQQRVSNKDAIKLQGDGRLKWNAVVQVMDVCRRAGFNNISFVPPPDFGLSGQ